MLPESRPSPVAARFVEKFSAEAHGGTVSFARFMELALYDAEIGYYRQERRRVGLASEADFYTATSVNPLFGELVMASVKQLLGAETLEAFSFVEVGAEPGGDLSREALATGFGAYRAVRVGDALAAAVHGSCVVFSNELFDAQPFHRVLFRGGQWRECGVAFSNGQFEERELSEPTVEVMRVLARLPQIAPEGYRIDLPIAAETLCREIVALDWSGVFVAFDYGKSWEELCIACPEGTLRAYKNHVQSNALFATPAEQDLTGHICWDWLEGGLRASGFAAFQLRSQESFFLHTARDVIARVVAETQSGPSARRAQLQALLHPAHMGQAFQVLHARR